MKKFWRSQAGFTLIEMIVVLVLIGLITIVVLPRGLREAADSAALDAEAQKLAGMLRLAKQKAMTRNVDYEVVVGPDKYILRPTGAGEADSQSNIDRHVSISPAGGLLVVFVKSTGFLKVEGPIDIRLENPGEGAGSLILEINKQGDVTYRSQ